jgi:hypothetical protein
MQRQLTTKARKEKDFNSEFIREFKGFKKFKRFKRPSKSPLKGDFFLPIKGESERV